MPEIKSPRSEDHLQVARAGANLVVNELNQRGASNVSFVKNTRKNELTASNRDESRVIRIRMKTKSSIWPAWQTSIIRSKPAHVPQNPIYEKAYWVFVDLGDKESMPRYWIAPESWVLKDIYEHHQRYLDSHGGKRARSPDSTHHKILEERLEQWQDKWDILNIFS